MSRRIVLLVLSLVLALVGTTLVFAYASSDGAEATTTEPQSRVVIASALVPAGMTGADAVAKGLVALADVPTRLVPAGSLTELTALGADQAASDIQAGEVLLGSRFLSSTVAGSMDIPDDKVAVSVEVADPQRVAGFVRPGSDVAVFATYEMEPEKDDDVVEPLVTQATRLLLARATVIAVGPTALRTIGAPQKADDDEEGAAAADRAAQSAALVTLAVSIEDAQKLAHSAQTGAITLGLLSPASRTAPLPADDNRTLFQ